MAGFSSSMLQTERELRLRGAIRYADGTEYALSAADFVSAQISEGVNDGILPGAVLSAACTFVMNNEDGRFGTGGALRGYAVMTGAEITLKIEVKNDADQWQFAPMGVYYVENMHSETGSPVVTLEGHDGIYSRAGVAFEDTLAYPCSVKAVFEAAAAQAGFVFSGTVPGENMVLDQKPAWGPNATVRDVLGHAAAVTGCCVMADRWGYLAARRLTGSGAAFAIYPEAYMARTFRDEYFGPVSGVCITTVNGEGDTDSEPQELEFSTGTGGCVMDIKANPMFVTGAAGAAALGQGMMEAVAGLEYTGCEFSWRGDPDIMPGRYIRIVGVDGGDTYCIVSRQTLVFDGGFHSECVCGVPGDADLRQNALGWNGGISADRIIGTLSGAQIANGTVTAAKIDVADLFANESTIQALNAVDISGNEYLHLYVGGKLDPLDEEVAALRTEINLVPGKIELAVKEIDEFHAGTTVDITKDEFRVSTPEFNVDIVGDDGETNMLSIDENGARMQSLTCPDVAPRYNGPATLYVNKSATSAQIAAGTHYRSIADAAAALSDRWLGKDVVVYVAAGTVEYGTVTLRGANGSGSIYIIGDTDSPAKLVGKLQIMYSGCPVLVRYLNVDSASGDAGIDCAGSQTMAIIENCVITGKGVSVAGGRGVRTFRGAHADVHGCELYDHERSLYAQQTGTIRAYNNKGNCRIAADGGTIYASGSMPCDTATFAYGAYAGQVITASDITVNGNAATPPEVETTPTTVNVTASATDSWYSASGAWLNQDDVIRQGYYSGMGEWSGCFWFPTTSFSGKTVKTASLTLTRTAGSGKSSEVTLTLYGITIASASGDPNSGRVSYGVLGTIGNGETKTFTLPTAAAQALASGTIKGFMLYAGDGEVMSGRSYSTNYCKIGSAGDDMPQLSVSY